MSQMSQENAGFRTGSQTSGGQASGGQASGLGERLADVGEKAATYADDAVRKAGNAAASVAEGAGALASDVGERIKNVGAEAEAMASAAKSKAGELEAMLADEVKAHPLRTLALAAAAGAILGFFAGR